jgi:probable addiction module antidote protein
MFVESAPRQVFKGHRKGQTNFGEILESGIMPRKSKKPFRDYEEDLVDRLKEPVEYLKAAIDEKDERRIFMNALSHIARARGVREISTKTKLNRESLYRLLSQDGNPTLTSLHAILGRPRT